MCVSLVCVVYGQADSNYGDIDVIVSDNSKIIFDYYPVVSRENKIIDNKTYVYYSASNCSYNDESGYPMMPERHVTVGLPAGGSANINIIQQEFYSEKGIMILPVPEKVLSDEISWDNYTVDNNAYSSDKWLGQEMYSSGEPSSLRKQTVQNIILYPLQYNPFGKEVKVCSRMRVEISFVNSNETGGRYYPDQQFEQVYKNVLINYEQAKNWRQGPVKKISKATGQDEGTWFKMTVDKEGVYILDKQFFESQGIVVSEINPKGIKIYNNGGLELPQDLASSRPEGLIENSIYVSGESDGKFDDGDFVLFYGKPNSGWNYNGSAASHYIHRYQDENIYWLSITPGTATTGKRMAENNSVNQPDAVKPDYFRHNVFVENENYKLFESGTDWYSLEFQKGAQHSITTRLPGYKADTPVTYKLKFQGGSSGTHYFGISEGNLNLGTKNIISISSSLFEITSDVSITDNESVLSIVYANSSSVGQGFLDWIEISYSREFTAVDSRLFFEAPLSNGVAEYTIDGFSGSNIWVFDVTDYSGVKRILNPSVQRNTLTFGDAASSTVIKQYAVVERGAFLKPENVELDENSDLRAVNRTADFIIITHDDFYDEALILENYRESTNSLETEVVKVTNIYDEFSCGIMDPAAIRDFLRYAYVNWTDNTGNPPSYVLLIGDGSYDYKQRLNSEGKIFIPPFEIDSNNEIYTRCTDDWYVYLDGDDRVMDMSIGRLPVSSQSEAHSIIQKIIQYESNPEYGFWKNTVTLVADDELTPGDNIQRIHTDQSETLANADYFPKMLNQNKVYLMDYEGVVTSTASGLRKPGAEEDFVKCINDGSVIVSYIGHGSYKVLAHEQVFSVTDDLGLLQNEKKLFFFYPATCAFGRYDLPEFKTFAEELLVMADGGAIGLFSSSREAFASQNFYLAQRFYQNLFTETPSQRVGDAVLTAKSLASGNYINNEKFHLFCDPTLRLALPEYRVDQISVSPDSMKALATMHVSGRIEKDNAVWSGFEGKVGLKSFDSEQDKIHVMENNENVPYKLSGASLFKGTTSVSGSSNGLFNMGYIVPKDITYGGNRGRVSIYFYNEESDGAGYLNDIYVGGTADVENDFEGPDIEIGFEGLDFISGDFVPENYPLLIKISDENGINMTGEIGHKIELIVDEDEKNRIDLTGSFIYDEGSYTEGSVSYPLGSLEKGKHTVSLKAWDNFNNSSSSYAEFTYYSEDAYSIGQLYNYPNPFSESTQFTFEISQPVSYSSDITIKIYTVAGRLIKVIENIWIDKPGIFVSEPWDGRDEDGSRLANGVYFYKIIARSWYNNESKTAESIGKIVVSR